MPTWMPNPRKTVPERLKRNGDSSRADPESPLSDTVLFCQRRPGLYAHLEVSTHKRGSWPLTRPFVQAHAQSPSYVAAGGSLDFAVIPPYASPPTHHFQQLEEI